MKILFISYEIGNTASGIISCRVANELAKQGHDIKVVAQRIRWEDVSPLLECYEVHSPLNFYSIIARILKRIGRILQLPFFELDNLWVVKSKITVERILSEWTPDFVYCRSTPFEPFIIGKFIKKKYGYKVLMHFTDLMPLVNEYPKKSKFISRLSEQFRHVIDSTDMFSFGTVEMKEYESLLLNVRFGDHFFISPDVVSDSEQRYYPSMTKETVSIIYFGYIYYSRNPIPLFEAIEELRKEGHKCDLTIYSSQANNYRQYDGVSFVGRCHDRENALKNADIFVDLTIEEKMGRDVYVSSKIKDYLLYNRPILSISGEQCATRELVKGLKTVVSVVNQKESIKKAIKSIIGRTFGYEEYGERLPIIEQFTPTTIVKSIIHEMSNYELTRTIFTQEQSEEPALLNQIDCQ